MVVCAAGAVAVMLVEVGTEAVPTGRVAVAKLTTPQPISALVTTGQLRRSAQSRAMCWAGVWCGEELVHEGQRAGDVRGGGGGAEQEVEVGAQPVKAARQV